MVQAPTEAELANIARKNLDAHAPSATATIAAETPSNAAAAPPIKEEWDAAAVEALKKNLLRKAGDAYAEDVPTGTSISAMRAQAEAALAELEMEDSEDDGDPLKERTKSRQKRLVKDANSGNLSMYAPYPFTVGIMGYSVLIPS